MKKVLLILVFLVALPIVFSDELYSEIWFASGNSFDLDGDSYSLLFQGTGNRTRILVRNEGNVSMSEVLNLGDCLETDYKLVCFNRTNLLEGYEKRIFTQFYKIDYGVDVDLDVSTSSLYIYDDTDVIFTFTKDNDITDLEFITFIPEDVTVSHLDGCTSEVNSSGNFILMDIADPDDEEECEFKLSSAHPVTFDIVGEFEYTFIGKTEKESIDFQEVEFKAPSTITLWHQEINSTEPFDLNITIGNPSPEKIKSESLYIHFPEEFLTSENIESSELSEEYYKIEESFSLDQGENKTFSYTFDLNYKGNYTIFLFPEMSFGDEEYIPKKLTELSIVYGDEEKEDGEVSKSCDGEDIYVNVTDPNIVGSNDYLNDTKVFLPGTEIDFILYISSETREELEDLSFTLYENNKIIGERNYDVLPGEGKIRFSRIYSIIPLNGASDRTYRLEGKYLCNEEHDYTYNFTLEMEDFADIGFEREAPGSLTTGEVDEITVTVENKEEWFVENVLFEEIIPEEFETEGVTKRVLSLEPDSEEDAYSYYIEAVSDIEGDYTITTRMTLKHNGNTEVQEFEKTISINNVDLEDIDAKVKLTSYYLNEPGYIEFEIENEGDYPARNLVLDFALSDSFDFLYDLPYKVPTIFPEQVITVELPVIPKKKENLTYYFKYNDEEESDEIDLEIKDQRIDLPVLDYSLENLILLDGTVNSTLVINNSGAEDKEVFISGEEVIAKANKTTAYTVNLDEKQSYLLEYEILGQRYKVYPKSVKDSIQEKPTVELEVVDEVVEDPEDTEEEDTENTDVEEELEVDEAKAGVDYVKIGVIVLVALGVIGGMIFFVLKKGNRPKIKKNIKKQTKVEKTDKEKLEPPEKPDNVDTSKIFSYDEYEKLKDNIEKK